MLEKDKRQRGHVTFSDVVRVNDFSDDYDSDDDYNGALFRNTSEDDLNDISFFGSRKMPNSSESTTHLLSPPEHFNDRKYTEKDDSCVLGSSPISSPVNERRPSLAVQLIRAPVRWATERRQSNVSGVYRQPTFNRAMQRKISLHGKPIYYNPPTKRRNKIRRMKIAIFNFLERPDFSSLSFTYHLLTFILVFACLGLTVLVTMNEYKEQVAGILFYLEIVIMVLFTIELTARIWSAGCRVRYHGFIGRLRFCRKPFSIIDILVVGASLVVIGLGTQKNVFLATGLRFLRFLQILRMVRMDRRCGTWKLLSSVVRAHSKELLTAWYIGFLALVFASFFVYQAERDSNEVQFSNLADALWWGLITLTTIGYGDKYPKTNLGRFVAACFAILGISFFALPAGILGSGFALKVQEQHRQKHFARRRQPAAYLIQCMWRCYAADRKSTSVATWQPYLRARAAALINGQSSSSSLSGAKKTFRDKWFQPTSSPFNARNGRKATFRQRFTRKTSQAEMASSPTVQTSNNINNFETLVEKVCDRFGGSFRNPQKDSVKENWIEMDWDSQGSNKRSFGLVELTEKHKAAIRTIRLIKFNIAKRKFKEALRPYDVKDVIEQYSAGHLDMLSRIKSLQSKVDQIASCGLFYRNKSGNGSPQSGMRKNNHSPMDSFHVRLSSMEGNLQRVEYKMDVLLQMMSTRFSDEPQKSSTANANNGTTRLASSTSSINKDSMMSSSSSSLKRLHHHTMRPLLRSKHKIKRRHVSFSFDDLPSLNAVENIGNRMRFGMTADDKRRRYMLPASAWNTTNELDDMDENLSLGRNHRYDGLDDALRMKEEEAEEEEEAKTKESFKRRHHVGDIIEPPSYHQIACVEEDDGSDCRNGSGCSGGENPRMLNRQDAILDHRVVKHERVRKIARRTPPSLMKLDSNYESELKNICEEDSSSCSSDPTPSSRWKSISLPNVVPNECASSSMMVPLTVPSIIPDPSENRGGNEETHFINLRQSSSDLLSFGSSSYNNFVFTSSTPDSPMTSHHQQREDVGGFDDTTLIVTSDEDFHQTNFQGNSKIPAAANQTSPPPGVSTQPQGGAGELSAISSRVVNEHDRNSSFYSVPVVEYKQLQINGKETV